MDFYFLFIKIKPTIVYFGFALIFLIYQVWKRESLVKRMLANHVNLNDANYNFLNSFWIFFFILPFVRLRPITRDDAPFLNACLGVITLL